MVGSLRHREAVRESGARVHHRQLAQQLAAQRHRQPDVQQEAGLKGKNVQY